jgi:protein TonB
VATRSKVFMVSVGLHVAMAIGIGVLKKKEIKEAVAIAIFEKKSEEKKKVDPPPPPPPSKEQRPKLARAAPQPKAEAPKADTKPPPDNGDALPEGDALGFGELGGGTLAIAGVPGQTAHAVAQTVKQAPKALIVSKPAVVECTEAIVKAKPISVPTPEYTDAARAAGVEGRVRVQVTIDATGRVTGAKVIASLGNGLDEAALAAARAAKFDAATRCGRPVATTFVIGMRFAL